MRESGKNEAQALKMPLISRTNKVSTKAPLWDYCCFMAYIVDECAQRNFKNINANNSWLLKNKRPQNI